MINLYNEDCLEVMKRLEDCSVDLVLTDPPYGTTSCKWDSIIPFEPMWDELKRITKPNAAIVLFGSQPFTSLLISSNLKMFRYELIWNKNKCGSPGLAKHRPMKVHENILVFSKNKELYNPQMEVGEPYKRNAPKNIRCNNHEYGFKNKSGIENKGTRYPKSILNISRDFSAQQQIHPTQKPVSLLEYLIKTYSNENNTVLDFTMGSGSTGVACVNTNRNFVGIELDKQYFKISEERINNAVNQLNSIQYLENTRLAFTERINSIRNQDNSNEPVIIVG